MPPHAQNSSDRPFAWTPVSLVPNRSPSRLCSTGRESWGRYAVSRSGWTWRHAARSMRALSSFLLYTSLECGDCNACRDHQSDNDARPAAGGDDTQQSIIAHEQVWMQDRQTEPRVAIEARITTMASVARAKAGGVKRSSPVGISLRITARQSTAGLTMAASRRSPGVATPGRPSLSD